VVLQCVAFGSYLANRLITVVGAWREVVWPDCCKPRGRLGKHSPREQAADMSACMHTLLPGIWLGWSTSQSSDMHGNQRILCCAVRAAHTVRGQATCSDHLTFPSFLCMQSIAASQCRTFRSPPVASWCCRHTMQASARQGGNSRMLERCFAGSMRGLGTV
jgi:hypothetical protein